MKKFVFTLERMLAYQEQNLEKEKGILARITAERDKLEEDRRDKELRTRPSPYPCSQKKRNLPACWMPCKRNRHSPCSAGQM